MVDASLFRHAPTPRVPYGQELMRSSDYKVYVNGREVSVYTCRISAYPFNRLWPGFQRPVDQSETVSFVNLVADEAVRIEVEPLTKSADGKIMVKPYAKSVRPERVGDRIRFTLTENGGYVFQIDDYHGLLYLFCNKPVPCADRAAVTHYFGPGIHFPGKITLNSGESVYVDKDAYVYGCVFAENAENIRIFGNGILDDSGEERYTEYWYDQYVNGNLKFYDCKNVRLEGVGFTNSAMWCINLFHCFDVVIDGVNVFGQWRYNTDGIDIVNSQRVTVENSFIHSFDDTVTVKGIDRYAEENCADILIENCALWCDWGKACELGMETAAPVYERIAFRNCDVLRGGSTVCDVLSGDCAYIHDVVFEDLRVELEPFYSREVVQKDDGEVYPAKDETLIPRLFYVHNHRFRECYSFMGLPEINTGFPVGDSRYAGIRDVVLRNVSVSCPESMAAQIRIVLHNVIPTTGFGNITVENVTLNGTRVTESEMDLSVVGCDRGALTVK